MTDLGPSERASCVMRMALAPDLKALRAVWTSFPPHVRDHPDMIDFKNKLKEQMK